MRPRRGGGGGREPPLLSGGENERKKEGWSRSIGESMLEQKAAMQWRHGGYGAIVSTGSQWKGEHRGIWAGGLAQEERG